MNLPELRQAINKMGDEKILQYYFQLEAAKGIHSLYYFNKEILGQSKLVDHIHGGWESFLSKGKPKKLLLMPREHFKSSFITIGGALWNIVKNPNIRILIVSATSEIAKRCLREIKSHIKHNMKFRQCYGDLAKLEEKWTESTIIVDRDNLSGTPTIRAVGIGTNVVGEHFDLIIYDDIVNRENTQTAQLTEKTKEWWQQSLALLINDEENPRSIWMVGTRWSHVDLYDYIIRELQDYFEIIVKSAIENGKPYFPEQFSMEKLNELKVLMGSFVYSCFYLNNPINPEGMFKEEYFKLAPKKLGDAASGHTFTGVDLAISKTGDYFVMVTIEISLKGNIEIANITRERGLAPSQMKQFIKNENGKYHPSLVYVENNSFQDFMVQELQEDIPGLPVKGYMTGKQKADPLLGIPSVAALAENGKIWLRTGDARSIKLKEELINECLRYGEGHTGDVLMALWFAIEAYRSCLGMDVNAVVKLNEEVKGREMATIEW